VKITREQEGSIEHLWTVFMVRDDVLIVNAEYGKSKDDLTWNFVCLDKEAAEALREEIDRVFPKASK
jgi:hypothetical protein